MAARRLPGTALRVRRGRRHDFADVQAVLGRTGDGRTERFFRRLTRDLAVDVYVAEDGSGAIVGVVTVAYARSLAAGGLAATLEVVRRAAGGGSDDGLAAGLVDFATDRARRRGCRALAARVATADPDLRAVLLARGFHVEEALVADLARSA